MKHRILAFSTLLALLITFGGCGKYEEGPDFSLRTKKARITGIWKIDKMYINDQEQTIDEGMNTARIDVMKDGTGKISVSIQGLTLAFDIDWKFSDDKLSLIISTTSVELLTFYPDIIAEHEILRLTNTECWLRNSRTTQDVTVVTVTHLEKE